MSAFDNFSIYIPSLHRDFPLEELNNIFNHWGVIERIDFVEMNIPNPTWIRAFVHFESVYSDMDNIKEVLDSLSPSTPFKILYYLKNQFDQYNQYCMYVLKNNAPVKKTTLNIHQIANNVAILKDTVEKNLLEARQTIQEQEEKIADLRQQLYEQDRIVRILMSQRDFPDK
jgi:hypothetical protein